MRTSTWAPRGRRWAVASLIALAAPPLPAQSCLPFAEGEVLGYVVKIGFGIRVGRGEMAVTSGDSVRGASAMLLRFSVDAGAGPIRARQRTASWIDPRRLSTLRFVKHERSPLSNQDDSVEVFPDEKRWAAARGAIGYTPTDAPLDELSFLYFLRTLPFGADSSWSFSRHYDPARSPTTVRVLGRERVKTDAGTFDTWKVEMQVRDPAHFRGLGRMTLHISTDAARVPVRIESDMREAGSTLLELTRHVGAPAACVTREGNPDTNGHPTAQTFRTTPDAP